MENRSSSRLRKTDFSKYFFPIDKEPKKRGRKKNSIKREEIKGKNVLVRSYNYKDYDYEKNRRPGKLLTIVNTERVKQLYVFDYKKNLFNFYQKSTYEKFNCELCPNFCGIELNNWLEFKKHLPIVEFRHNHKLVYLNRDSLPDLSSYSRMLESNNMINFYVNNSIENSNFVCNSLNNTNDYNLFNDLENNSEFNEFLNQTSSDHNVSTNQTSPSDHNLLSNHASSDHNLLSNHTSSDHNLLSNPTSSDHILLSNHTSSDPNLLSNEKVSSINQNTSNYDIELIDLTEEFEDHNIKKENSITNQENSFEKDKLNQVINLNYDCIKDRELKILDVIKNNLDNIFLNFNMPHLIDEQHKHLNCRIPNDISNDYLFKHLGENYLIDSISIDNKFKKIKLKELIESTSYNCLNLDLSTTKLNNEFEIPESIKELKSIRKKLNYSKNLLILKQGAFIDFHVNYLQSDLEYFCVIKGELKFYLILPNDNNMNAFNQWFNDYDREQISLIDKYELKCFRFLIREGQTILIPKNYIYAISSSFDTIIFAGDLQLNYESSIKKLKDNKFNLSDLIYRAKFPFFNADNYLKMIK